MGCPDLLPRARNPRPVSAFAVREPSAISANEFRLFRELIHRSTGIWLREGKQMMLASRLLRRLRALGLPSFGDYYSYVVNLRDDDPEVGELINCITTNKTAFFREFHHFKFLADEVIPEMMNEARETGGAEQPASIRIWSAACSTGEEPYSIAMTLLDAQQRWHWPASVAAMSIIASDIDTHVLSKAVQGVYADDQVDGVASERLKKYFLRGTEGMAGKVRLKKVVTSMVDFRRINLMDAAWPLSGFFDVVFFRNALIYFRQETQDAFLRRIIRHLRPGGYLFLGHSEHIPWLHDLLEPLQPTVYRIRSQSR